MMHALAHTGAIILAAGTSSRMGNERNKLLLPVEQQPVLLHVIRAALGSRARPIVVVVGHQADEIREQIQQGLPDVPVQVIENPDYAQGQSTSMQTGLHALLAHQAEYGLTGAIFLLGDQPMLSSQVIDRLLEIREQSGKRIVLPLYRGQRGNPVVFSLDLAPELFQVSGDEGGRSILKRHPDEIATLEIDEETSNLDVDTWEAYQQVLATWQQQKPLRQK